MKQDKDVYRPLDAEAVGLCRRLVRTARHGALAVLDPATGAPGVSRVGLATDSDGAPLMLISGLSAHTRAVSADPRCSLLVGEPGKGDPLAYPRLSISCEANRLDPGSAEDLGARRRFLNRNPKAALYAGLPDFSVHRLRPLGGSLNAGFGKAYHVPAEALLDDARAAEDVAGAEQGALDHMNADHADAVSIYAEAFGGGRPGSWKLAGIDPAGLDLVLGDEVLRVDFPEPLASAGQMRAALVALAKAGRSKLEAGGR